MIPEGQRIVDLTCGLGIDAFHLARKSARVTAIDLDPTVSAAVEPNAKALGISNVTAVNDDCARWLKNASAGSYDICFIDPARRGEDGCRLFSLHDCRPDVTALLPEIFRVAGRLIVKMSPMLDIDAIIRELPGTQRVYILGTQGECKEIVADVRADFTGEPEIIVQTIDQPDFRFIRGELPIAETFGGEIKPGDTIGEPWPTMMKANPRAALSGRKLHPETHLWLNPDPDFPGKLYKVERIEEFSSGNIKRLARQGLEASVAVKNLPITASELSKRLKVKESATSRLIGCTISPSRRLLLFLSPLC